MIKKIDLSEWVLFSDRRYSANYLSKDGTKMVKIFNSATKMTEEEILKQKEISDRANAIGLPVPLVYDIVKNDNNELGIVGEYIDGKKSISRALSEDYENKEKYLRIFYETGKKMHSTKCDTSYFRSANEIIKECVNKYDVYNEKEKKNIFEFLDSLPKSDTCLLGDFQFSNVIFSGDKSYLIDYSTLCYGNPIIDQAFLYFFTHIIDKTVTERILHISGKQMEECYDIYEKMAFCGLSEEECKAKHELIVKLSLLASFIMSDVLRVENEIKKFKEKYFKDTFNY